MLHSTSLNVLVPPSTLLQTVAMVKKQLRIIDEDADSELLTEYITAAVEWIESQTSHCFHETQFRYTMDRFPYLAIGGYAPSPSAPTNGVIKLPRSPLMSVQSVEYIDTNGTLTTLASDQYQVDTYSKPGRIWPKRFAYWPITDPMTPNGVQVTFKAGYSSTTLIPHRAKQAIRFLVHHWNEKRSPVGELLNDIPGTLLSMIRSLKITVYNG